MQFDTAWKTAPKITDKLEMRMNLIGSFLGIIIESDGEVFQEVHHISWLLNGKFWPEVRGHVHGQVRKIGLLLWFSVFLAVLSFGNMLCLRS
jgi:hypothetical protein